MVYMLFKATRPFNSGVTPQEATGKITPLPSKLSIVNLTGCDYDYYHNF